MKQILLILVVVALAGCGTKEAVEKPEPPKAAPKKIIANPIVEKAIRKHLKKPKGELNDDDLEKVTELDLSFEQLTNVKDLEKLTQLTYLVLDSNKLTSVSRKDIIKIW